MKCPKCRYLGFETGDRCKNCGYDFSLIVDDAGARVDLDLPLRDLPPPRGTNWLDTFADTAPVHLIVADDGAGADDSRADVQLADIQLGDIAPRATRQPEAVSARAASDGASAVQAPPARVPLVHEPVVQAPATQAPAPRPVLPLFSREDMDAPLLAVPTVLRTPLAVRRTPVPPPRPGVTPQRSSAHGSSAQGLSAQGQSAQGQSAQGISASTPASAQMSHGIGGRGLEGAGAGDLVLEFGPEPPSRVGELPLHPEPAIDSYRARPTNDAAVPVSRVAMRTAAEPATAAAAVTVTAPRSSSGVLRPRAVAGLIDHGILLGIDAVVLYFTLRMTGLTASEWSVLPLAPLLAFLVFVKLAYFGTFTVIGGQTIGKMATRLRVVTDDARTVGLSQGLWRAAASLASVASLGAGLLPILLGNDRRAFHDRVAGTRVVSIPHA